MSRKMGPLDGKHPMIGEHCLACKDTFKAGDYVTLVSLGPGDDEEEREKMLAGRPYNAVAIPVHWDCAHHDPKPRSERLASGPAGQ